MMTIATEQPDDPRGIGAAPNAEPCGELGKVRKPRVLTFRLRSGARGAPFGHTLTSPVLSALGDRVCLSVQATGPRRSEARAIWQMHSSWDGVNWTTMGNVLTTDGIGLASCALRPTGGAYVRVGVRQERIDPRVTYVASLSFEDEDPSANGSRGV